MASTSRLDEILRDYFQEVVHTSIFKSPKDEGIVEFAERSKVVREKAKEQIKLLFLEVMDKVTDDPNWYGELRQLVEAL